MVQSIPPPQGGEPSRHWWGDYKGGGYTLAQSSPLQTPFDTVAGPFLLPRGITCHSVPLYSAPD